MKMKATRNFLAVLISLAALFCLGCTEQNPTPGPEPGPGPEPVTCTTAIADTAFLTAMPDAENTDETCSNHINDFHTKNKDGSESTWFDCDNYQCTHSMLVQVCNAIENTDALCSDHIDNPNAGTLHNSFKNQSNGLIDCEDPSCFKNPRITVCADKAPRYELGTDCHDGIDNDGDGLADCNDPDCLHAKASCCELTGKKRILFDNAHHEVAGAVDWIIDVTGRHPFPSMPVAENQWHGSLSSYALDLLKTGNFVVETLIQNRTLTYNDPMQVQDLSQYDILVLPEPSSMITASEASAVYEFVRNGGRLLLIANHAGADRDGNMFDSVVAINSMLASMPGATSLDSNPFGFYVLDGSFDKNSTTVVAAGAENHPIIKGSYGEIHATGMYGAAGFQITNPQTVTTLLTEKSSTEPFAIAATFGAGKIVAIGDSAIFGDGTNYLGLKLNSENGYVDGSLQNRELLLNATLWLAQ